MISSALRTMDLFKRNVQFCITPGVLLTRIQMILEVRDTGSIGTVISKELNEYTEKNRSFTDMIDSGGPLIRALNIQEYIKNLHIEMIEDQERKKLSLEHILLYMSYIRMKHRHDILAIC